MRLLRALYLTIYVVRLHRVHLPVRYILPDVQVVSRLHGPRQLDLHVLVDHRLRLLLAGLERRRLCKRAAKHG